MNAPRTGAVIALAMAGLFATTAFADPPAPAPAPAATTVKCQGINACKGQGSCASADNSCKGQNGCKGQGWLATSTEKECTDKGGKVMAEAPKPAPAPAPAPKKG
jgi:hypothetical protein